MTALRQSVMRELERLPEDKISSIIQIMQDINGVYDEKQSERKEAFSKIEWLRKKHNRLCII